MSEPKEVLYLTYDGLTDPLGQSQIIPYLQGLTKHGYRFTILSFEKEENFSRLKDYISTLCESSGIRWNPLQFHTKPPLISKWYDRQQFAKEAERLYLKHRFSLLHCRSYVSSEVALRLKRKYGVPFIFDMRGFWADEKKDAGRWKLNNPIYKKVYNHYKELENDYVINANHIISLTRAGKQELGKLYEKDLKSTGQSIEDKCTVIPTCADLDQFHYLHITDNQKQDLRNELNIPENATVLTYSGSLGTWYMLDEMLDFFQVFKKNYENAIFLFLTRDKPFLEEKIKEGKIDENEVRVAFAQKKDLPVYLSLSFASVFFIKNTYSKKASSPTKHAELMGLGIPVFCNVLGDTGYFMENYNLGVTVSPGNDNFYQFAIDNFKDKTFNKEEIRACALQHFDVKTGVDRYLSVYNKILNQ